MLKLILGQRRTGKTERLMTAAKTAVGEGKKVIMLVPEQYSFECQRNLLYTLGASDSNKIDILSFTSLCEEVCALIGGAAAPIIDDGTRYIVMRQALIGVRDSLRIYSKYCDSASFVNQMLSTVTELKQADVTPEALSKLSKSDVSEMFSAKLSDVSLIMSAYDSLLVNRFTDPSDILSNTVARMNDCSFFYGKTVLIDEFKGFTESQFKMLDRIIAGSETVLVSFCCDGLMPSCETDIFSNVKSTARRLSDIARSHSVKVEETEILTSKQTSDDIAFLERVLSETSDGDFNGNLENVSVTKAADVYSEADFCMNKIHKLVRTEGYRYKDFVIIARDSSIYDLPLFDAAELYGIPLYCDSRTPLGDLPFTALAVSALKAAVSLSTEDILRVAKTGLTGLTSDEVFSLENYTYTWSIDGKKWLKNWNMNVGGLNCSKNDTDEKIKLETENIDGLRQRLILPIKKLGSTEIGTAAAMCTALLRLFEEYNVTDNLATYTSSLEKKGLLQEADRQRVGYDAFIKVLDKIVAALGDCSVKLREFSDILAAAIKYETVGDIPLTLDQVMYGTADRIKPFRAKAVFVLGANQGVFPAETSDGGFFSRLEREKMILSGLKVADCAIKDTIDEKFLFYLSCTAASDKTYISYSEKSASGAPLEPSYETETVVKKMKISKASEYGFTLDYNDCETEKSAFVKLSEHYRSDSSAELRSYFSASAEYNDRLQAFERAENSLPKSIEPSSAELIYGGEVKLSASKVDDYSGCSFMYFCKYGLGAAKRERVDFDSLTRGNIVHYCLEHFVSAHLSDIGNLKDDDISLEVCALCDDYLAENRANTEMLDEKFKYMMTVVKSTVVYLAEALNREFAQSGFAPKCCELRVGDGEEIEGINILTDYGQRVTLNGCIDRVDTTKNGSVRVIDYKTGSKGDDFKLSEILNGQNMQMLLYLRALLENGRDKLSVAHPGGVLYFPAKKEPKDEISPYIKMNGLLINDIDTLRQMESQLGGKIIPAKAIKSGDKLGASESLLNEEAFCIIFKYIELILGRIGTNIMSGNIEARPLSEKDHNKCEYCDYSSVCRVGPFVNTRKAVGCKTDEALEAMKKEIEGESYGI